VTPAVLLAPYDPQWPALFEAEAARIERALVGLPIRLEHIGSTAVPGLAAKPIIDILAGRPPRSAAAAYVAVMRQLGYEHMGAYGIPGRNYFRRGTPRTHHVHLVSWTSRFWKDHLRFRDALREHPSLMREYETLKYDLAATLSPEERRVYTDAKGPFIRKVLRDAAQRAGDAG
jgi:GrpB-like predicted nucleotidyltransferase (UPF0157 family)